MTRKASERRVVMAKRLAQRWVKDRARPEHRLTVYYGSQHIKNLTGLLRSFRDEKLRIGSVEPITDLGIKDSIDSLTLWSSDREGLLALNKWFEARDFETSGVW